MQRTHQLLSLVQLHQQRLLAIGNSKQGRGWLLSLLHARSGGLQGWQAEAPHVLWGRVTGGGWPGLSGDWLDQGQGQLVVQPAGYISF